MSDTKSDLFRSICQPALLYGLDAVNININLMEKKNRKHARWYNEEDMVLPNVHIVHNYYKH